MTEIKTYKCDICGSIFDDEASCRKCEKNHIKSVTNIVLKFNEGQKVPYVVHLEFDNGFEADYERKNY